MKAIATQSGSLLRRLARGAPAAGTLAALAALSGCLTLSGDYVITAVGADGQPIAPHLMLMAHGSGIYTVINAICSAHPDATVSVHDVKTGVELKSESPKQCSK